MFPNCVRACVRGEKGSLVRWRVGKAVPGRVAGGESGTWQGGGVGKTVPGRVAGGEKGYLVDWLVGKTVPGRVAGGEKRYLAGWRVGKRGTWQGGGWGKRYLAGWRVGKRGIWQGGGWGKRYLVGGGAGDVGGELTAQEDAAVDGVDVEEVKAGQRRHGHDAVRHAAVGGVLHSHNQHRLVVSSQTPLYRQDSNTSLSISMYPKITRQQIPVI